MAKHRAPVEIEIASTADRTWLHEFVDRYWKAGVVLALAVAAGILLAQVRGKASRESLEEDWNLLVQELGVNPLVMGGPITAPGPAVLESLAEDMSSPAVAFWARMVEVGKYLEDDRTEQALNVLDDLQASNGDRAVLTQPIYPDSEDSTEPLRDHIQGRSEGLEAWEAAHPLLFGNPDLPADAPRVRLNTSAGPIVVALYVDRAPQHAENFLSRCREGAYEGTHFHRVVPGVLIQGGDPASREGEPDTWGQGNPEDTLEKEIDPLLRHFPGALGAVNAASGTASDGSMFTLMVGADHDRDGQYTVFGRIVEGMDVARAIANAPVDEQQRPVDPVVLESTEILE